MKNHSPSTLRTSSLNWRLGIGAALAITLLSLVPQVNFMRLRGRDWHGSYYSYQPDEYPYSAYVNALIQGRPRRNDPYTGAVDQPNAPLPESIFSIQFVPAYLLALPARVVGISAATSFIFLTPLVAFSSALFIFWLMWRITGDERLASLSVPFILCLGALARGQFFVRQLGGLVTPPLPFPFLRRYEPALAFPLFFLFCGLLWILVSSKDRRVAYRAAIGAGFTFALLVFSYFFLWTAAVAVLASVVVLWTVLRPEGYKAALRPFALLAALCLLALVPYVILLSHRSNTVDSYQLLTFTHSPDLTRPLAWLCIALLVILVVSAWRRVIPRNDSAVLFTVALTLAPLLMFNQQVVTGRSLQAIHYEQFIANYVSLLALLLTGAMLWRGLAGARRKIPMLLFVCVSVIAFGRGVFEARFSAIRNVRLITAVDEFRPVALRLLESAPQQRISETNPAQVVLVLSPPFQIADSLPTTAPQAVLWALHSLSFTTLTARQNKERYFQQLYYSGIDLQQQPETSDDRTLFRVVNFGWDRTIAGLSANWRPVNAAEEQAALREYETFVANFDRERATHPTLSFAVTSEKSPVDSSNLDRWYERDAGERIGDFILYRVRPRP